MIERQQPYVRQLHVCINDRKGESKSCGYEGSEEIVEELRQVIKERNLKGKSASSAAVAWMSAPSAQHDDLAGRSLVYESD